MREKLHLNAYMKWRVQNDITDEHIQMFFENNNIEEDKEKEYILDIINGVSA